MRRLLIRILLRLQVTSVPPARSFASDTYIVHTVCRSCERLKRKKKKKKKKRKKKAQKMESVCVCDGRTILFCPVLGVFLRRNDEDATTQPLRAMLKWSEAVTNIGAQKKENISKNVQQFSTLVSTNHPIIFVQRLLINKQRKGEGSCCIIRSKARLGPSPFCCR